MFWAGRGAMAELFKRDSVTTVSELSGSYTSKATGTGETLEESSVQRESSDSGSNLSLREWSSCGNGPLGEVPSDQFLFFRSNV